MAATRAPLGAWEKLVDGDDRSATPISLVSEHLNETTPTDIGNALAQFWVADHVLYLEGFDADDLVFVKEAHATIECREVLCFWQQRASRQRI